MLLKRVFILFLATIAFSKAAIFAPIQQVKNLKIVPNYAFTGFFGYNQCDMLLNKNIILIGSNLFSVKNECILIHNFFPGERDLSFFKKVKISPDGKYFGFLCNGSNPLLHVWKTDDLSAFNRFTKVNINRDDLGIETRKIESFCFSDDERIIVFTSPKPNNLGLSFDDLNILSHCSIIPVEDEGVNYFHCINLKNDIWSAASIKSAGDFFGIDFCKREGPYTYFVGKRACGDIVWLGCDEDNLYELASDLMDFATKMIKFSSDNKFVFFHDGRIFKMFYAQRELLFLDGLLSNQNNLPVLDTVAPTGCQLKCAAYETALCTGHVGRFALIYCCESKIVYREWLT